MHTYQGKRTYLYVAITLNARIIICGCQATDSDAARFLMSKQDPACADGYIFKVVLFSSLTAGQKTAFDSVQTYYQ